VHRPFVEIIDFVFICKNRDESSAQEVGNNEQSQDSESMPEDDSDLEDDLDEDDILPVQECDKNERERQHRNRGWTKLLYGFSTEEGHYRATWYEFPRSVRYD
jgi:hypothetical protein